MTQPAVPCSSRLHSRYKPDGEAERYIGALSLEAGIDCFILIEPGLGYLVPPLRKRFPKSVIIALHADSAFKNEPGAAGENIPAWYPDSAESAQDFLERHVPEAARPRVIEWRPALRLYGERCRSLLSETAVFLKRALAGRRTAAVFGRKWVRNFFKNITLINTALIFSPFDIPVVVTGSGPGLESACPLLARIREKIFIIAASSSLPALAARGIQSDMAITTDGGSWALIHLFSCFRRPEAAPNALAAALCAAMPSQCAALPVLALSDGSLWQRIALQRLNFPFLALPQRGTVSASAVDAALALTSGPVCLAGLDLSVRDIREHARPYGFDHLFYGCANRFKPEYSQRFARSGEVRRGGSLEVYAGWFKKQLSAWPERIFAFDGSSEIFDGGAAGFLRQIPDAPQGNGLPGGYFKRIAAAGTAAERRGAAVQALREALDDGRFSETLKAELVPLLFPGERTADSAAIAGELKKLALPGRGETYG